MTVTADERITELEAYYREKGNSNVPSRYPPNQPLSNWVRNIRSNYQIQQATNGGKTSLNQRQVKRVEEINFNFRVHNNKRPKIVQFETLAKLICAYVKDYPLLVSRVDFNSRTVDLPEKYRDLPELCARIQTAQLSKAHTKALENLGVKFLPSALRTANVGTTGNQIVIFADPPLEATQTTNLAADSTNGNLPSPVSNTDNITHSSRNPHDLKYVLPPESEPFIELADTFGTVLVDVTNRTTIIEESSPPEEWSVRESSKKKSPPAPKRATRVSSRICKARKQIDL